MTAVHALVLAAGAGSRFGGGKLSAPWRGRTLLDGALDAALAAPVAGVVVVTGADPTVRSIAEARAEPRLRIVHAASHAAGLSASLRAGLAALPEDAAGALVFLGDMPRVPRSVLTPLVEALIEGAAAAVPTCGSVRGHPAALSRLLFPELALLGGDRGAGALLDRLGDAVVRIETTDPGVLEDVDYPDDLARL